VLGKSGSPQRAPGRENASCRAWTEHVAADSNTTDSVSLRGKFGPYVLHGNQQIISLIPTGASFTWGEPYSEMEGKLVAATGALRFFHSPDTEPASRAVARAPDYFYFEAESAQLRLISR
jgi:hypothetical protein